MQPKPRWLPHNEAMISARNATEQAKHPALTVSVLPLGKDGSGQVTWKGPAREHHQEPETAWLG